MADGSETTPKQTCRPEPSVQCDLFVPAVNNDRPTEEILEGVDAPPQFQEEVWLPGDSVVGPTHELDVGHLPL